MVIFVSDLVFTVIVMTLIEVCGKSSLLVPIFSNPLLILVLLVVSIAFIFLFRMYVEVTLCYFPWSLATYVHSYCQGSDVRDFIV